MTPHRRRFLPSSFGFRFVEGMGARVRGGATGRDAAVATVLGSGGVKGEVGCVRRGEKRRQKLHDNFSSIDPEV